VSYLQIKEGIRLFSLPHRVQLLAQNQLLIAAARADGTLNKSTTYKEYCTRNMNRPEWSSRTSRYCTVSNTGAVRVSEPDIAVTVTV
jgi:hypothetical protein